MEWSGSGSNNSKAIAAAGKLPPSQWISVVVARYLDYNSVISSSTMDSLDKNGSAIHIDCIANCEKMDVEKNSDRKNRTYGVEGVGVHILGAVGV